MKTMKLAFVATLTLWAESVAHAQTAASQLDRLVELSSQRLLIAEQVALAKWDNGAPVEDASREAQVVAGAVKTGESKGLEQASVSAFFKAQIEASKLVQYALLAGWRRVGRAPGHTPVDLVGTIRPQLDQVDTELIAELTKSEGVRVNRSCPTDIAKAVGKYVSAHKNGFGALKAIALDRALAAACTSR
jgi:chorismate mutase